MKNVVIFLIENVKPSSIILFQVLHFFQWNIIINVCPIYKQLWCYAVFRKCYLIYILFDYTRVQHSFTFLTLDSTLLIYDSIELHLIVVLVYHLVSTDHFRMHPAKARS